MAKSFIQFLKQKITVSVLITVVVFNIFNPVADNIFTPLVGYIIDPSKYLEDSKITVNNKYVMKYGIIIKQIIVSVVVLGLIYYVDKFFF